MSNGENRIMAKKAIRQLTRRELAKSLALAPVLAAGAERRMFLALNSVLISGRVKWPDFARLAAKVGFPGTDVALEPAMEAGAAATRDLLAQLNVKPAV